MNNRDAWTPWNGGKFPDGLALSASVLTRHRNGWERRKPAIAQFLDWHTTGKRGRDIVAYQEVTK